MSWLLFGSLINVCVLSVCLSTCTRHIDAKEEDCHFWADRCECIEVVLTVAARWDRDSLILTTPFVISQFLQLLLITVPNPQNAQKGPCVELATHPGWTLPGPSAAEIGLQQPSRQPSRDKADKKKKESGTKITICSATFVKCEC